MGERPAPFCRVDGSGKGAGRPPGCCRFFAGECVMVSEGQSGMPEMANLLTEMGPPVMELFAPKAGERVLDLGCGSGFWSEEMVRRGCEVVGIDSSAQAVAAARARGVDARQMNAEAMTFESEFDGVFSNAALHWMRHPSRVVAGVTRALKSGGRFVGECGETNNVRRIVGAVSAALEKRGIEIENLHPWRFVSKEEAVGMLEAGGMVVKSVEVIERPTVLPGTIAQWLSVFANNYLSCLHPKEREAFSDEVMALCRPALLREDGKWFADFVRLRFYAVKP
ncbi:methyltransferase domain-containing protein [Oxalobacter aliiformigenes]|uniref:Methyltransferase domain-containing protein n=2 Tax=Oxalobacter aliiformigenes TaxID=2946593 RepID=A0A9E9LA50_9BURK|nr:class I SAM-dependent methyltransferase [Oxalobacter aliiformigenes]WAV90320.1 methyltransferase domain-containing protein [Oxalobacter aliiformigenes]